MQGLKNASPQRVLHAGAGEAPQTLRAVQRRIEAAHAREPSRVAFLAPDWKQTFDSIKPKALPDALRIFGGPPQRCLAMIGSICQARQFCATEMARESQQRRPPSGIAQ
eukprot:3035965-Pyramimonas_sp.AAC.1